VNHLDPRPQERDSLTEADPKKRRNGTGGERTTPSTKQDERSYAAVTSLTRAPILRQMNMNRGIHSVVLAGAFLLFAVCTSPATDQPSANTMNTQKFEFVSNGNRLSGVVDISAGRVARAKSRELVGPSRRSSNSLRWEIRREHISISTRCAIIVETLCLNRFLNAFC
jgi:hypothetical protein